MISPDFIKFCILGEQFYDSFHFFGQFLISGMADLLGISVAFSEDSENQTVKGRIVEVREHGEFKKETITPLLLNAVNPHSKPHVVNTHSQKTRNKYQLLLFSKNTWK